MIPLLIRNLDARVRGNQRVDQVDARLGPVIVPEGNLVTARACGWHSSGSPQADYSRALAHLAQLGKVSLRQRERHGLSVGQERDGAEHLPRVCLALGLARFPVVVCIDPGKDLGCHGLAGGQIHLHVDAVEVDREARGLKIFIEAMRVSQRERGKPGAKAAMETTSRRAFIA